MILTGKKIKELTGKHLSLEDNVEYEFEQNGKNSSARRLPTPEELAEQEKQLRISELKRVIPEKQLCGLDVTEEQTELKTLLGY